MDKNPSENIGTNMAEGPHREFVGRVFFPLKDDESVPFYGHTMGMNPNIVVTKAEDAQRCADLLACHVKMGVGPFAQHVTDWPGFTPDTGNPARASRLAMVRSALQLDDDDDFLFDAPDNNY